MIGTKIKTHNFAGIKKFIKHIIIVNAMQLLTLIA